MTTKYGGREDDKKKDGIDDSIAASVLGYSDPIFWSNYDASVS